MKCVQFSEAVVKLSVTMLQALEGYRCSVDKKQRIQIAHSDTVPARPTD